MDTELADRQCFVSRLSSRHQLVRQSAGQLQMAVATKRASAVLMQLRCKKPSTAGACLAGSGCHLRLLLRDRGRGKSPAQSRQSLPPRSQLQHRTPALLLRASRKGPMKRESGSMLGASGHWRALFRKTPTPMLKRDRDRSRSRREHGTGLLKQADAQVLGTLQSAPPLEYLCLTAGVLGQDHVGRCWPMSP